MSTKLVPIPTSHCRFGFARRDITPPVGIYHRLWGAATHDRATGVHRPLYADVLALAPIGEASRVGGRPAGAQEQGAESAGRATRDARRAAPVMLRVVLDLGWLLRRDVQPLREAVASAGGVAIEQVLVSCNHSHAAANVMRDRVSEPGGDLILPYLETLRESLCDAARAAVAELRPATITYGWGRCSLAAHRDYWDEEAQKFVCGFNPDAPADDTVLVARVVEAAPQRSKFKVQSSRSSETPTLNFEPSNLEPTAQRLIATLVNYGCHPTTLAWENTRISPDYPGACREVVEEVTGAPCAFLLGACGELGPRAGYVGDSAVADRNGRQLGYAALSALEGLGPPAADFAYAGAVVSGATLGTWEYRELAPERRAQVEQFDGGSFTLPLPVRPLPARDEVLARRAERLRQEALARAEGASERAREWRALAERDTRLLGNLANLPAGGDYPLEASVWRAGDAVWVTVEGEVYSAFQTLLRARFPGVPILVSPLTNGWDATYLPPASLYGKGIYQEEIALLAPGALEAITEETARRIEALMGSVEC